MTFMIKLGIITGLVFEAAILEKAARDLKHADALTICAGPGHARARQAAAQALNKGATALMSFGIAGGLDSKLKAGTIVMATDVRRGDTTLLSDALWTARIAAELEGALIVPGTITHSDQILAAPEDKARLFAATGAVAVDMESYGVAEAAAARGVPFAALRAIADEATDALPDLALKAATPTGHTRVMSTALGLLASPGQLGGLMRLARRTAAAQRELKRLADLGLARSFFV